MTTQVILSVLLAFAISAAVCPVLIPFLKKLKFGQQVRDDGPQAHLKKQGTPTMGGLAFLISVVVTSLFFIPGHPRIVPVLFMTVGFGVIGFLDDYLKIVMKRSEGLNPKQKMALQIVLTAVFCVYLMKFSGMGTVIHIPFLGIDWEMGWLYVPMVFLVVLGTDNGVNFTDGLDGLCSSVTVMVAIFFTFLSLTEGGGIETVTGAVAGALAGFLLFNVYPAQVFMGDTGSLALGGFVASSALMLQNPLIILLVGFIYLVEVISVILQVAYFKKTGGKRLFRMAPIHHHFELGGWSETRIVAIFSIVTALLCLVAYLGV
ncbi:MAG: phospho-N-acetylmuramoyl-pentapeptide-transferase [Lachnospiraceae bacterium]|nr:phospho-N-acetylmuramoyl-pentapeptide-transferase [Lachnospiraceae bacterium]MCD8124951.1 phospho-N-acetylmuramoyl-pentapeptide-transferase [Lachnospiraceae bacterium]